MIIYNFKTNLTLKLNIHPHIYIPFVILMIVL